jgi:hypothetical protein
VPFVLRWVVGVALLAHGLAGAHSVYVAWPMVSQIALREPSYPYLLLAAGSAKLLTAGLLLVRSRLVFVTFIVWCASFAWLFLGSNKWSALPAQVFFAWMEQLALLGFLFWLHARKELR